MNKKLLLLSAFLAGASWTVLAQDLVLSEGQYYTDETQTTPYTGRYTEFYEDGMLKMELYLKDGRPEGTYVIYYPDGKIAEVVFILDGEIYDDNATYFVLADTDRESGDYDDDDYYWEYENAYVDGQKQSVFIDRI